MKMLSQPFSNLAHEEIAERAASALTEKTGLQATLAGNSIELKFDDTKAYLFDINIIPELPSDMALFRKSQLSEKYNKKTIIITRYISKPKAEKLQKLGLLFLDTVGNTHIYRDSLFVLIKGNIAPKPQHHAKTLYSFQTAGLKVILTLLYHTQSENFTYQQLAKASGVSESSISKIFKELNTNGYLDKDRKKHYHLINRVNLLNEWLRAYPKYLRPKTLIGHYSTADENWWKNADIASFSAYWGEQTAAALLTNYLRPEMTTVYLTRPTTRFLLKHKLNKNPVGDIVLREQFWHFAWATNKQTVPALLVYADLLATGDSRNIAAAEKIYQNELIDIIKSA